MRISRALGNYSGLEQFGKCSKLEGGSSLGCSCRQRGMAGWEGRQLNMLRRDGSHSRTSGAQVIHVRSWSSYQQVECSKST